MAIVFATNVPQALLNDFKKKIDNKEVVTWSYDGDGDFTHTPDQWKNKAWLRPSVTSSGLAFKFVGARNHITTWAIYAVYQGRFIESMTTHCHALFSNATATAKPTNADIVTSQAA